MRERRAIISVPGEMGRETCWGTEPGAVQHPHLRRKLQAATELFIKEMGGQYIQADGVHVYGPFPSMLMLEDMLSEEAMTITREQQAQLVLDRDSDKRAFSHYLLNAHVAPQGVLQGVTHGIHQHPLEDKVKLGSSLVHV